MDGENPPKTIHKPRVTHDNFTKLSGWGDQGLHYFNTYIHSPLLLILDHTSLIQPIFFSFFYLGLSEDHQSLDSHLTASRLGMYKNSLQV